MDNFSGKNCRVCIYLFDYTEVPYNLCCPFPSVSCKLDVKQINILPAFTFHKKCIDTSTAEAAALEFEA